MTRWISSLALALGVAGLLMLPATSHAGVFIKEHDCVGNDLTMDLADGDAGCTPDGSPVVPPVAADGGPQDGNTYGTEDSDDFPLEGFLAEGAHEMLNPDPAFPFNATGIFQTIPTVREHGHLQVGQQARFTYDIGVKGQSVVSQVAVTCSVCAARPQSMGDGATFVEATSPPDEATFDGESAFFDNLNSANSAWGMRVQHHCGPNRLDCRQGQSLSDPTVVVLPGLIIDDDWSSDVAFIGCQPTTVLLDNEGAQYIDEDILQVIVDVPGTARVSARMDASSCEIAYLRECNIGEDFFKPICAGNP